MFWIILSSAELRERSRYSSSGDFRLRMSTYSKYSSFNFCRFTIIKCFRLLSSVIISFTISFKNRPITKLLNTPILRINLTINVKFSVDFLEIKSAKIILIPFEFLHEKIRRYRLIARIIILVRLPCIVTIVEVTISISNLRPSIRIIMKGKTVLIISRVALSVTLVEFLLARATN